MSPRAGRTGVVGTPGLVRREAWDTGGRATSTTRRLGLGSIEVIDHAVQLSELGVW